MVLVLLDSLDRRLTQFFISGLSRDLNSESRMVIMKAKGKRPDYIFGSNYVANYMNYELMCFVTLDHIVYCVVRSAYSSIVVTE